MPQPRGRDRLDDVVLARAEQASVERFGSAGDVDHADLGPAPQHLRPEGQAVPAGAEVEAVTTTGGGPLAAAAASVVASAASAVAASPTR